MHPLLPRVHICLSSISRNFNMFPFLLGWLVPRHARRNRMRQLSDNTKTKLAHGITRSSFPLLLPKKFKPLLVVSLFAPFASSRLMLALNSISLRHALSGTRINNQRKKNTWRTRDKRRILRRLLRSKRESRIVRFRRCHRQPSSL